MQRHLTRICFYRLLLSAVLSPLPLHAATYPPTACLAAVSPDLDNDGRVSYKDLWLIGRSFGLDKSDRRYQLAADTDCNGAVDAQDWDFVRRAYGRSFPRRPALSGDIYSLEPGKIKTYVGHDLIVSDNIELSTQAGDDGPFTVRITQTLEPKQGLLITNPLRAEVFNAWQSNDRTHTFEKQLQTALLPEKSGSYTYQIVLEVPENGYVLNREQQIDVLPAKQAEFQLTLALYPELSHRNGRWSMNAEVRVHGENAGDVADVLLVDADSNARYSAHQSSFPDLWQITLPLSQKTVESGACHKYYALATTPYASMRSPSVTFCPPKPIEQSNLAMPTPSFMAAMKTDKELKAYFCAGKGNYSNSGNI